jgi:hypothetical protein
MTTTKSQYAHPEVLYETDRVADNLNNLRSRLQKSTVTKKIPVGKNMFLARKYDPIRNYALLVIRSSSMPTDLLLSWMNVPNYSIS